MQHIKYIGRDFDEKGILVETFEYRGHQYTWTHNGHCAGQPERFHRQETAKIDQYELTYALKKMEGSQYTLT